MLRLGIIGLSEGNGHPYSWSAIINGDYDDDAMADCGFPVIPAYLAANRDTLGIDKAKVTHIWTQDRKISEHVAKASLIDSVLDDMEDMIGCVDAVLLARDDPENHVSMARPFLDEGIPIFIDKPLAISWEDLEYFEQEQKKGRLLMSCSALRYSAGIQSCKDDLSRLGRIKLAVVVGEKDWRKYAIHWLEGMFALLDDPKAISVRHVSESGKDIAYIEFENGMVATIHVFKGIAAGGAIDLYGKKGCLRVEHGGAYPAFRNSLVEVIRSFEQGRSRLDFKKTRNVVGVLIAGQESLDNGGKMVNLK